MIDLGTHKMGFDARYWNGYLSEAEAKQFAFCYIKLTDGIWKDQESTLAKKQYEGALKLGIQPAFFHFWRFETAGGASQQDQAGWFFSHLAKYPDAVLPPCHDFEDPKAPKTKATGDRIQTYGEAFDGMAKEAIVYTGKWWWDAWVGSYEFKYWSPYNKGLWEADPDPDTATPGKWKDYVIRQYKLDVAYPGFQCGVDLDYARNAWWDKYVMQHDEPTLEEKVGALWDAHPELH